MLNKRCGTRFSIDRCHAIQGEMNSVEGELEVKHLSIVILSSTRVATRLWPPLILQSFKSIIKISVFRDTFLFSFFRCSGFNNCTVQLENDEPQAKQWGNGKLRVLYNCIPGERKRKRAREKEKKRRNF